MGYPPTTHGDANSEEPEEDEDQQLVAVPVARIVKHKNVFFKVIEAPCVGLWDL